MIKLPLFPLPVFILPGGVTRLRIFEARYLKMVKIASENDGFVIKLSHKSVEDLTWASWVNIIDFDQGSDGILQIDVKCKHLVNIISTDKDNDNLNHAIVESKPDWQGAPNDATSQYLADSLKLAFNDNKELAELYNNNFCNEPNWVIARWLEILPIKLLTKNQLIQENSLVHAKQFLEALLLNIEK